MEWESGEGGKGRPLPSARAIRGSGVGILLASRGGSDVRYIWGFQPRDIIVDIEPHLQDLSHTLAYLELRVRLSQARGLGGKVLET